MSNSIDLSKLKIIPISNVIKGQVLINLGEVIEIDSYPTHINLIISRLNEKQVVKFGKEVSLVIV